MHTSRLFAHDLTVVNASALLLFGGDVVVRHREGVVLVGGWVRLRASPKTAVVCVEPRCVSHIALYTRNGVVLLLAFSSFFVMG
jgi:hypothetical protein